MQLYMAGVVLNAFSCATSVARKLVNTRARWLTASFSLEFAIQVVHGGSRGHVLNCMTGELWPQNCFEDASHSRSYAFWLLTQ